MTDNNVLKLNTPEHPLQEVLREETRKMLANAIEAEVAAFLKQYGGFKADEGKSVAVRNGYMPERTIQTGLADIEVKASKIRGRLRAGIKFNSSLIPPCLKHSGNTEEFPLVVSERHSNGRFCRDAETLVGAGAPGLPAATISRLKQNWEQDCQDYNRRDLSKKCYIYVWTGGVYSNVKMDDWLCLLVMIGSDEMGCMNCAGIVGLLSRI